MWMQRVASKSVARTAVDDAAPKLSLLFLDEWIRDGEKDECVSG